MSYMTYMVRETMAAELETLTERDWLSLLADRPTDAMERATSAVRAYDEIRKEGITNGHTKSKARRRNRA